MRWSGTVAAFMTCVTWGTAAAQQRIALPSSDTPLQGRPTDVWSVGAAEGESWELLSNVRAAVFDAEDNLYALDAGNQRVLVFDRDGRFVRSLGKRGGGPGEFQSPQNLALTSDGRLVVAEGRGFSIFRTDGTFERFVPSGQGLGGLWLDRFGAHPSGGVIARTRKLPDPGGAEQPTTMPTPILHFPLTEDQQPDTIASLTEPAPVVRELGQAGARARVMMMTSPRPVFARALAWTGLPDGSAGVAEETDAWEIRVMADGGVSRILTRDLELRVATERDRDRAREERRRSLERGGDGPRVTVSGGAGSFTSFGGEPMTEEQIRQNIEAMTFAERIPLVQDLFAGADGRLWVERAPAVWGDPPLIDLIDVAQGRYIGTVSGIDLPIATSRSGLAAWVEKDELEVERIVVRRLPAGWSRDVGG